LKMGSCFLPRLTWTTILSYTSHHRWDFRHTPPHPASFHWGGLVQTSLLGLAQNAILLVSVSQVARITGVSHGHLALLKVLHRWTSSIGNDVKKKIHTFQIVKLIMIVIIIIVIIMLTT
jgi:hypothetical protein